MNPLAILSLLKDQKERVVWALIALAILSWTWNTASDVGKLKAEVGYQAEAMQLMTQELGDCK